MKKENAKRLTALLLCAMTVMPAAMTACSDSGSNGDKNNAETLPMTDEQNPVDSSSDSASSNQTGTGALAEIEADYDWKSGVTQKDYDGHEFVILNGCTASWYSYTSIAPEETSGEPVKDAFVERNLRTSDYLNITIKENNDGDSMNILKNAVKAGTNDFDMALVTLMNSYAVAMENNIFDLNTLESADFSKVWWDQNAVNDLTINNKLYFITSDFDTTRFDGIRSLYFNKAMIDQMGLENPYELVDNNQWTMDKFTEMCTAVVVDKDGDGVMTDADQYGYVGYSELIGDLLLYGMGERYISKDPDTGLIIDSTGTEKFYDAYEKVYNLLYREQDAVFDVRASKHSAHLHGQGDRAQEIIFTANNALFYSECMAWTRVLRDMEADFGVLPPPKYNEEQDRYYSVIINPFMQMIPITSEDPERTLHIMDVLGAASHDTVVEAYVNVTLTGKVARDEDTVRMLHLVFNELAYNLHFTSVGVRGIVNGAIVAGTENIASSLQKNQKVFKKQLEKTNQFFFG